MSDEESLTHQAVLGTNPSEMMDRKMKHHRRVLAYGSSPPMARSDGQRVWHFRCSSWRSTTTRSANLVTDPQVHQVHPYFVVLWLLQGRIITEVDHGGIDQ
uniref:Uncharacterized protein n=1 Tax=Eutreptiella gymnastica TaxID=73025 RepID=A0A7S1IL94_9EUGL|mmetsp:Transcript_24999/g.45265  ORF Transcript_24999/g.45265 Transcript_24999/m.45265 type:complete len:101 (+) Transcript_24999:295-597(+)